MNRSTAIGVTQSTLRFMLLQLLADALGVFAVVFHVVLQQGDAVLAGVNLLVQAGLPSPGGSLPPGGSEDKVS